MKQKELLKRSDVPAQDTWDTTTIFADDNAFETAFKEVESLLGEAEAFQGRLAESAETLIAALDYRNTLIQKVEHLYTYAHLNSDVDTSNSLYQGLQSRGRSLYAKVASALSFYESELLAADETILKQYLQEPGLKVYQHEFEILFRRRPHILSQDE
jgi:oligoendopeptidase F